MERIRKLHVLTGDGKGKTSAAVGMAARFVGHGGKAVFAQFLKDGTSGELSSLRRLGVLLPAMPAISGFFSKMAPEEQAGLIREYEEAVPSLMETIRQARPGLVILDEFSVAVSLGVVTEPAGRGLVSCSLSLAETVVTGRNAPEWLLTMADYATVLREVHHPWKAEGLKARRGIEY